MKFFFRFILISSCLSVNSAYPCDVLNIPVPSHLLPCLYSKLHIQPPKSVDPNTVYSIEKTLAVEFVKNDPSFSSQEHLNSMKVNIQYAYEHGLYLRLLSISEHFHYCISELANHDNELVCRLEVRYNDTSLTTLYGNSNYLLNVNSYDNSILNKTKIFIETKVTAMKLQGFNL